MMVPLHWCVYLLLRFCFISNQIVEYWKNIFFSFIRQKKFIWCWNKICIFGYTHILPTTVYVHYIGFDQIIYYILFRIHQYKSNLDERTEIEIYFVTNKKNIQNLRSHVTILLEVKSCKFSYFFFNLKMRSSPRLYFIEQKKN